ncbi:hypothetical protein QR680_004104 [Steinernema hermaphroditum]|uniref:Uncharacterized protein n=1 Tax=Steinernema hermaphroditum TaxID=289476 RepID=A0AA39LT45_9BILA|nr:hypothetical protein QR680_004104 [Steinernema hermaphroditum]
MDKKRLLLLLLLFILRVNARVRFTYLGDTKFDGKFDLKTVVNTVHDCTTRAHSSKRIGFRIMVFGTTMSCEMLASFTKFQQAPENGAHDYILNTNSEDKCTESMKGNVTEFISGECTLNSDGCGLLDKIRDYCTFIGSDIANCVSSKNDVTSVECPPDQDKVGVKKGVVLCCPKGQTFAEENDGKAFCCPSNTEFKGIVGNKTVCCNPGENYEEGWEQCCPDGKSLKTGEDGLKMCCDGDLFPSKSPKGTACCPKGEVPVKMSGSGNMCCPKGEVLKGEIGSLPICCNATDTYKPNTNRCCPKGTSLVKSNDLEHCCKDGLTPSMSADEEIGCCPKDETFAKAEGGIDYCCPQGKVFEEIKKGKATCCKSETVLKGYLKDGKPACCPEELAFNSTFGYCCCKECIIISKAPLKCAIKTEKPFTIEEFTDLCKDSTPLDTLNPPNGPRLPKDMAPGKAYMTKKAVCGLPHYEME